MLSKAKKAMNQKWIGKVLAAELNQTNKSSDTNKEVTHHTQPRWGEFLKDNWEGRDKIIKKIVDDTTIFYYTSNYLPLQNTRCFDPYWPPGMNK
jgi:hypothetical protein